MKLIEDDFGWSYCGDDKHVIIDIAKHPRFKDPYTVEEGKQLKQQILDDQEDAVQWRHIESSIGEWQNIQIKYLDLVELIEKEFQYYDETFKKHKDIDDFKIAQVLQKLLRGCKK